jgi:hypothetical protein
MKDPYIELSNFECLNSVKVRERMNNDYVNSGTINQASSKLLLNCSDGVLRLYQFDVSSQLLVLV